MTSDIPIFGKIQHWSLRLHTQRNHLNMMTDLKYLLDWLKDNDNVVVYALFQRELSDPPRNYDHWHMHITTACDTLLTADAIKQSLDFNKHDEDEYCQRSRIPAKAMKYVQKPQTRIEGPYIWSQGSLTNAPVATKNILSYFDNP